MKVTVVMEIDAVKNLGDPECVLHRIFNTEDISKAKKYIADEIADHDEVSLELALQRADEWYYFEVVDVKEISYL